MEKIGRYTVPNSLVFLADAEGYIVMIEGETGSFAVHTPYFQVGTYWGEEAQGTNAVALVMREQQSFQVEGAEHYYKIHHSLACGAAPIFSPEGEFLAVLGVATPLPAAHPHTLGMVVAAAAAVENQLGLERASDQLYSVVQSISDGLIAIDNNGLITHMNGVAGSIFGLLPEDCIGRPVEEIFRDSFALLRVIKTGREGFNDRELAVDINGRRVRVTVTSRPICSQQGKTFGVVLTCREMKSVQRLVNRMVGAQARFTFADLIGEDPEFTETISIARRVARTDSTVLIVGESGTGKEMFAQAIHNASPRRNGPFVAINCAALPRDLVESELFGYEEGAFTGAKRGGRPGKFELASGGTLFLDEIGDIPLETQVSLLRVLQERQVTRIGGPHGHSGGDPGHCRHQQGYSPPGGGGAFPPRSLLPPQCNQPDHTPLAGAGRGCAPPGPLLPPALCRAAGAAGDHHGPGGGRALPAVPMAGERPGAAECHRTGCPPTGR